MDPPRTITWTFNGVVIDTGSETTSFNISRQISSSDYGVYTCSASNEFGSDNETIEIVQAGINKSIFVRIISCFNKHLSATLVPPTLIPEAIHIEVEIGMSLTLSVNITKFNLGITDIVWSNDDASVRYNNSDYATSNSSLDAPVGTAMLFIESVTSPVLYGGIYRVTVSNPAGSDSSIFNVSIASESKNWILYTIYVDNSESKALCIKYIILCHCA